MANVKQGFYAPGRVFRHDNRRWIVTAVAHTGESLEAATTDKGKAGREGSDIGEPVSKVVTPATK